MSTESKIDVELLILKKLASGLTQSEVSKELKVLGVTPSSLSWIEKFLKRARKEHRAETIIHLFVKLAKRGYFD